MGVPTPRIFLAVLIDVLVLDKGGPQNTGSLGSRVVMSTTAQLEFVKQYLVKITPLTKLYYMTRNMVFLGTCMGLLI